MSNVGLSANSKNIKKFQLQQKGKNIVLVLVIVVPIFIAGVLYVIFQQYVSESRNTELVTDFDEFPSSSDISQPTDSGLDTPSYVPSTTDNQAFGSSQDSTGGLTTPNTGSVQPAPSGIPNGVAVAMNSIESNGIKGSSYISSTLDTSNLPDGSTVQFDRNSWIQAGPNSGSVNATVTAYGTPYQGSVTFESTSGSWKVTGYSLQN